MAFINYNGKFIDDSNPIIQANNRGFRFGDGVFETMKFKKGKIILLDEHLSRLWQGLKRFQFDLPKLFTPDYLESQILALIQKNKHSAARIRLTVFRGNGGLYDPENLQPNFIIESWNLPETNGDLNENGLQCILFKDALKSVDAYSNLKHNNYLPYLMGALQAKKMKCNDAIIFNSNLNVCDSTIANVFLIKENIIYTPALSEGCIAGIMREFVINELRKNNFNVVEQTITENDLANADEVFLTNSIYNMRWVSAIDSFNYQNKMTIEIYHLLKQTNPQEFC
jgi:branched-chain amino acid aminotransferase